MVLHLFTVTSPLANLNNGGNIDFDDKKHNLFFQILETKYRFKIIFIPLRNMHLMIDLNFHYPIFFLITKLA